MFAIIGIVVVMGAVLAGYLLEHGKIAVLMQPAELVIIGGAALGTVLVANPPAVILRLLKAIGTILKGSHYTQKLYLDTLRLLYDMFQYARKSGLSKLEADVEAPHESQFFSNYAFFLADQHMIDYVCDTMRMALTGGVGHFELNDMMEADADVCHREAGASVQALTSVADALPGLGIVAAVLGIVITMGALGGPPEQIGHKVAAALVGTFLGILMSYGLFGPVASHISKLNDAEFEFYGVLRVALVAFVRGAPPILAVEFARRSIPHDVRPAFKDMEAACKGGGASASASAAA